MFNHLNTSQKGMLLALVGFTSYSMSDICAKWLLQEHSIYQTVMMNNVFACFFLLLAVPKLGGLEALRNVKYKRLQIIRSVLNALIGFMVMKGFAALPIADVYTFIFAMPFYAALIAIPFYKEHVCKPRWIAIIVGFAGVLLALQPGTQGFNPTVLWPLGGGILIAIMFVMTKSMQGESLFSMGFWPIFTSALLYGGITVVGGTFEALPLAHIALFACNGVFIAVGILCVSNAFRMAPAAAVSPFLYTEMIWALLFGYLIFGDVPNGVMLVGAGIIILSGFYLIETERRNGRKKAESKTEE